MIDRDLDDNTDGPPEADFVHVAAYREGDGLEFAATIDEWALLLDPAATAAMLHGAARALTIAAEDFTARAGQGDRPAAPVVRLVTDEGGDDDGAA